jgi:endonuclease/exonuclease/phosphatase family metal-dependent hydrolase
MPELAVATWNLENLFRPEPTAPAAERTAYQAKLDLLGGVVRRLALDVVAVQEVGGQEELDDLAAAAGPDYAHRAVSAFPDGRGIRVGFLSRLPIEEQEDVVDFPPLPAFALSAADAAGQAVPVTRLGRGALRVRVRVGGTPVELLTAHLKSKLLTFPSRSC